MKKRIKENSSKTTDSKFLILISVLFATFLILSNLSSIKLTSINFILGDFTIDGGFLFFPLLYILADILTEVYGFKTSRYSIWLAFIANIIVVTGLSAVNSLPPAPDWHNQQAFDAVFSISHRILIASLTSYLFGEFINAFILAKLKVRMKGKFMEFRLIFSTVCGVMIENLIFFFIAFYGEIPTSIIFEMIVVQFILKIAYETLSLPITVRLINYLKRVEHKDHYDRNLSLSNIKTLLPFSD